MKFTWVFFKTLWQVLGMIGLLLILWVLLLVPSPNRMLPTYAPTLTAVPFNGQGTWDVGQTATVHHWSNLHTQSSMAATQTRAARGSTTRTLPENLEWIHTETPERID